MRGRRGRREAAVRFAFVLRIWVSGRSSYGAPVRETGAGGGGGGTGATGAEADTVAAGRAAAVSRSRRTTRPPGPDPVSNFRSTPDSLAMRLASGDALTGAASAAAAAGGE